MQLKCDFFFYWHSELNVVQSSRLYNVNKFKVCLIQDVSVPDASCEFFYYYCCLLQAVCVPAPSCECAWSKRSKLWICLFLLLPDPSCSSACRASTAFRMSTQRCLCLQSITLWALCVGGGRQAEGNTGSVKITFAHASHSHTLHIHTRTHTRQPFESCRIFACLSG